MSRPLLLLDVDGVLCPFKPPFSSDHSYLAPDEHYRPHTFTGADSGRTMRVFVSEANGERVQRLREVFEVIWTTGWNHHANAILSAVHALPHLPVLELLWDDSCATMEGSWKLPHVSRRVDESVPCAWIDDDLRPDVYEWAESRRGPTLLLPTDPRVGLTDDHVERALEFGRAAADLP